VKWVDEYEAKLKAATLCQFDVDGDCDGFTLDENKPIIAASPEMVAKLIQAVRVAEDALERIAKASTQEHANLAARYLGGIHIESQQTLAQLQSGEFGEK
jgi:hypothetical protein